MTLTAGILDAAHTHVWSTGVFLGRQLRLFSTIVTPASTAWTGANDAYAVPFLVSTPVTFIKAFFISGTTTGTANFDLGIYNDQFGLIRSLGATAAVNNTDQIMPIGGGTFTTPVTLTRGRYYLAMSAAATTITVRAALNANQVLRGFGMFKMASAHPLPATFVPASMGTTAFLPTLGLMTTANTIF